MSIGMQQVDNDTGSQKKTELLSPKKIIVGTYWLLADQVYIFEVIRQERLIHKWLQRIWNNSYFF